jgi:NAD(P)-dependent dehydrogenase (short-subunit alcohol dehydrogenase family)
VTIGDAQQLYPASRGDIVYLYLDLIDLATIQKSADDFLAKEQRLDVLWNNAGVMVAPLGFKTVQVYELQLCSSTRSLVMLPTLLYV